MFQQSTGGGHNHCFHKASEFSLQHSNNNVGAYFQCYVMCTVLTFSQPHLSWSMGVFQAFHVLVSWEELEKWEIICQVMLPVALPPQPLPLLCECLRWSSVFVCNTFHPAASNTHTHTNSHGESFQFWILNLPIWLLFIRYIYTHPNQNSANSDK